MRNAIKTRIMKSLGLAVAFGLTLGAASTGLAQCCLNFPPFPGVLVHTLGGCTVGDDSFEITLGSTTGMPIPFGTYDFWCVDNITNDIRINFDYPPATLYSSCDQAL